MLPADYFEVVGRQSTRYSSAGSDGPGGVLSLDGSHEARL